MLLWLSGFGLIMHLAHHGPHQEAISFGASQAVCLLAICVEAGYHEANKAQPKFLAFLRLAALLAIIAHASIAAGLVLFPGFQQAPGR
jgi:hypothetical protein